MAEKLPTQAGRKALLNIAAGRACHGAYVGTVRSLRYNGLIDQQNQLTTTGQKMIERLTIVPEVAHVA